MNIKHAILRTMANCFMANPLVYGNVLSLYFVTDNCNFYGDNLHGDNFYGGNSDNYHGDNFCCNTCVLLQGPCILLYYAVGLYVYLA